jgi:hypothetical protein
LATSAAATASNAEYGPEGIAMHTLLRGLICLALSVGYLDSAAAGEDPCKFSAERRLSLEGTGLEELEIVGRGGDLQVRPGSTARVDASGRACASSAAMLGRTQIRGSREGARARVFVQVPDDAGELDSGYATLNLVVNAPAGVAIRITDTSGDVDVEGVRLVQITDSSGDVEVRGTTGDLEINDSSGDLELIDIDGALTLTDSSGDITVGTARSVHVLRDSSGDIRVDGVKGDVVIDDDSSGDIYVDDIGGNVAVVSDSTGERSIGNVRGSVRQPPD